MIEPDVEMLFRQQFRHDLRAGRFQMEFAQSGDMALERITDAADVSLILIRHQHARNDRPGVITQGQGPSTGCPLIMITAYGDADTKQTALEQGAETLFTKPIDFGGLRSEIDLRVERAPVKRPVVWSNVRYWHLADISFALRMSAFGGKADIMIALRDVPLMTQSRH